MSNLMQVTCEDVIGEGTTYMRALRISGFEPHVELCLRLAKNLKNPIFAWHMVHSYYTYLVWPFSEALGGFVNYNLTHLQNMAFLRLLPLRAEELRGIRREAFTQSPSARSLLQKEECRINVFRGGKIDARSLNAVIELAEKYPEVGNRLAEYQTKVASGNLTEASIAAHRFSEVLAEQYNKEIKGWKRKEISGKVVKKVLNYGASIVVWPPILLSNIPIDWKLSLVFLVEVLKRELYARVGTLDVKKIVEALYDVKNWPFVEKGIPYLLWRTQRQK